MSAPALRERDYSFPAAAALSLCVIHSLAHSLAVIGSMVQSFFWGHLAANCCVGSYIHITDCMYACVCERDFAD